MSKRCCGIYEFLIIIGIVFIYEIKLSIKDIIKIGVIGLTINKREDKTFYDVGNKYTLDNLFFYNYEKGLESEAEKLRENGAHSILVLCSVGLNCTNKNETSPLNMNNKTTNLSRCEPKSTLYKLLNKNNSNIIDGIIAGDPKNDVIEIGNNIPIMNTQGKART